MWIVLAWVFIVGTRPVSAWLGTGTLVETPEDYIEGSPLDRNVFVFLLILGLLALLRRRVEWGKLIGSNLWFLGFFVYGALSIIWSDYPFVSLKRWTKELGCVVMVLIVLTESKPAQAFQAILARFCYIAVALSVVFIKYFPEIGRYLNRWTWEYAYGGITQSKNELGIILFVCGIWLIWEYTQLQSIDGLRTNKVDLISRIALLLMIIWLMDKAKSSTSTGSLIIGGGLLIIMRFPTARSSVKYLGIFGLLISVFALSLYLFPEIMEEVVSVLDRDTTLTGRTNMWADLLKEAINPILGAGYQSFWLGPGAERIWAKYYFHPTQAHNGYLEVYLNGGLVGLCFVVAMIISTARRLRQKVLLNDAFGIFLFSFLVAFIVYNITEASIGGLNILWIILITAGMYNPRRDKSTINV